MRQANGCQQHLFILNELITYFDVFKSEQNNNSMNGFKLKNNHAFTRTAHGIVVENVF